MGAGPSCHVSHVCLWPTDGRAAAVAVTAGGREEAPNLRPLTRCKDRRKTAFSYRFAFISTFSLLRTCHSLHGGGRTLQHPEHAGAGAAHCSAAGVQDTAGTGPPRRTVRALEGRGGCGRCTSEVSAGGRGPAAARISLSDKYWW